MGGCERATAVFSVRVCFFSRCSGVIWGVVLSGRGVRRCSGLFRFVRICSGLFRGDSAWMVVPGVRGWLADREMALDRTFVLLEYGSTVGGSWGTWTIGARDNWCCMLGAFHPPPNLPPERGEG